MHVQTGVSEASTIPDVIIDEGLNEIPVLRPGDCTSCKDDRVVVSDDISGVDSENDGEGVGEG